MAPSKASVPLEIEVKFLFPSNAYPLLENTIALKAAGTAPAQMHQVTAYYDTPELDLLQVGFSLRVRQTGGQYVQTLKTQQSKRQLNFHRKEWEWHVTSEQPDLDLLSGTPLRNWRKDFRGKLAPVWTTDIRRTVHTFEHNGALVECSLDDGVLRSGEKATDLQELELELKRGPVTALYDLALKVMADNPLRLGVLSKAERGYFLLTGSAPPSKKTKFQNLSRKITLLGGFRSLARTGLNGIILNLPAVEQSEMEGIHQMRVAIRQVRTILRLFAHYEDDHTLKHFQKELRRIGRLLGKARDWDVFCQDTLPNMLMEIADSSLKKILIDIAQEERRKSHELLHQELKSKPLTILIISLSAWIEGHPLLGKKMFLRTPLHTLVPDLLKPLDHKITKQGSYIRRLSAEELHTLRKTLKKLRYSASYFSNFYARKNVKPYMDHCKKQQHYLGEINDTAIADTLLKEIGKTHTKIYSIVSSVRSLNKKRRKAALHALEHAWKKFRDTKPFWA
ncbi:hypothetical protein ASN_3535 [Acetobacter senegalensis]|uniref:CHAD domain-containing protein n=1 Tax=Acetobacter senegalensis TaxID=446692 RepID=A0A0U5EYC8_9PROT|nr:CYTH and CHAD domain-containing protein [Acetobacter senegalensis]CEF42762.1 hypothetical protein ASN_3535 [Acetobacter senegalensis]